jgi:hypothetical protein
MPGEQELKLSIAADDALKVISHAEGEATLRIANANREAIKLVAEQAAEALKVVASQNANDHNLLIRLEERLEGLKTQLIGLKDGLAKQVDDHECRLDVLEKAQNIAEGRTGLSTPIMMMVGGLVGGPRQEWRVYLGCRKCC